MFKQTQPQMIIPSKLVSSVTSSTNEGTKLVEFSDGGLLPYTAFSQELESGHHGFQGNCCKSVANTTH